MVYKRLCTQMELFQLLLQRLLVAVHVELWLSNIRDIYGFQVVDVHCSEIACRRDI